MDSFRRFLRQFSFKKRFKKVTLTPLVEEEEVVTTINVQEEDECCSSSSTTGHSYEPTARLSLGMGHICSSKRDWDSNSNSIFQLDSSLDFNTTEDEEEDLELDEATVDRRDAILDVLEAYDVLTAQEASLVRQTPRYSTAFSNKTNFDNFLWLPDHLAFSSCFVDYINHRCSSGHVLSALLRRRVDVAVQEAAELANLLPVDSVVQDLLQENNQVFYSFCLGRAVTVEHITHCSRCHVCYDRHYWHCDQCNKCSYGLSFGKCEHCGYMDEQQLQYYSSIDSQEDDTSLDSVSQLLDDSYEKDSISGHSSTTTTSQSPSSSKEEEEEEERPPKNHSNMVRVAIGACQLIASQQ